MSSAVFRINQPGITGGKPVTGEWGIARQDLDLYSVGGTVAFEAQDGGAVSYAWTLLSQPASSSAVLVDDDQPTCTIDIDVAGGYLVQLIVDAGEATEDVLVLYFGVVLANSGLALPALSELDFDNSEAPNDGARGWEKKLNDILIWADANSVAGVAPFETGAGTLSAQRKLTDCEANGDYSFATGRESIASEDYALAQGYGSEAYWPSMWALAGGKVDGAGSSQVGILPVYGSISTPSGGGYADIISSVGTIADPANNPHVLREWTSYACSLLLIARFEEKTAAWIIEFAMRRGSGDGYLVSSPNYNKYAAQGAVGNWDVSVDVNATYDTMEIIPYADDEDVFWSGQLRLAEIYENTPIP